MSISSWFFRLLFAAILGITATPGVAASLEQMHQQWLSGKISAREMLAHYQDAIAERNAALHAIIAMAPDAETQAEQLDATRKAGSRFGTLAGIAIALKDNIDQRGMATTAGSLALTANLPLQDATVAARLRAAGALLFAKTNLSEWANFRSTRASSGWSAVGGQTRNPFILDRSPCGSSSGSAVAVAAGLTPAAIGTETDGSITCPAAMNGIVGLKPTVGLVSRAGIIPISRRQDSAGPMTRSVRDAALLMNVLAGSDPADPASAAADKHKTDYLAGLKADALKGKRLGVVRAMTGYHEGLDASFEYALSLLRRAGAVIVDPVVLPNLEQLGDDEMTVLSHEFQRDLDAYLKGSNPGVATRDLKALITYNREHANVEMPYFRQELFLRAQQSAEASDQGYRNALARVRRRAGPEGIDAALKAGRLDALIAPTTGPAWTIDVINGDHFPGSASTPAAVAGYPHLTVPMGQVEGLPVGLSFFAGAWSEARLLAFGYAFEQIRGELPPPRYLATLPVAAPPAAVRRP